MVLSIISTIFIQFCRENKNVNRIACFKLGPGREWKHYTNYIISNYIISIACYKGEGCLSVACSRRVAVLLTWATIWWLVEPGSRLFPSSLLSPSPSRGHSCSESKAGRQGVSLLASFKFYHFTKWSCEGPTQEGGGGCAQRQEWERLEQGAFDFSAGQYIGPFFSSKPFSDTSHQN